jgi:hypothetical protein
MTLLGHLRAGDVSPARRRLRWLTGSAGVAAVAVTLISGCGSAASSSGASSSGAGSAGSSSSGASSSHAAKTLTAQQAVSLAARTSRQLNSASSTLAIKVTGPVTETTTGSMQLQLKPSTLMSAALTVTTGGKTIGVDEVLGSKAVYLKVPGVSQLTGRPWLEISFAQLSGKLGASFGQLLQSMQNGDPLSQTQLFAAARDVRAAGTQTIDGVQTTRYTGSYSASSARAALPPGLRGLMGPGLTALTGDVQFTVWIDASHHVRRLAEVEHVNGATVNSTINITAINQPVHITTPPASQVAPLSRRMLSGAGSGGSVL